MNNLMPFQEIAFNGDFYICNKFLQLKEQFNIKTAIELGTCLGSTTVWLARNFERVHTVEINAEYLIVAQKKFERDKNTFLKYGITSWLGDSGKLLSKILLTPMAMEELSYQRELFGINRTPIIFIDSHWENSLPLPQEMKAIASSGLKPVIAIHDFKTDNPEHGFDTYNGQPLSYEWIKPMLREIYKDGCDYCYNSEAAGAKRGIIYITPKI